MRTIESLFADYAAFHQTKGNKAFHRLGIPMIMLTLIGMLARVVLFDGGRWRLDAGMLLILVAEAYYLAIEWRLAIVMLAISVACYFIGSSMPLWLNAALFVLGWIFQFVGHSVYEKRQPAFLRNFVHLLIGPLWIVNDVVGVVKAAPDRA
jgi:uncharacterized membrane protein YGL010W